MAVNRQTYGSRHVSMTCALAAASRLSHRGGEQNRHEYFQLLPRYAHPWPTLRLRRPALLLASDALPYPFHTAAILINISLSLVLCSEGFWAT